MSVDQLSQQVQKLQEAMETLHTQNQTLHTQQTALQAQNQEQAQLRQQLSSSSSKNNNLRAQPLEKKTSLKFGMPSSFSGDRNKLRDFVAKLQVVLDRQDRAVSDEEKIGFVASYLEGPALSWFSSVKGTNVCNTFETFLVALKEMFGEIPRDLRPH